MIELKNQGNGRIPVNNIPFESKEDEIYHLLNEIKSIEIDMPIKEKLLGFILLDSTSKKLMVGRCKSRLAELDYYPGILNH